MKMQHSNIKKCESTQFIHKLKDVVFSQPIFSRSFRTAKHAAGLVRTVFRKVVDSRVLRVVQYLLVLTLSSVLLHLRELFEVLGWLQ